MYGRSLRFGVRRCSPYPLLASPRHGPPPVLLPIDPLPTTHIPFLIHLQRQVLRALLLESLFGGFASWSAFVSFLPTKKPSYDFTSCASHFLAPLPQGGTGGEGPSPSPISSLFHSTWDCGEGPLEQGWLSPGPDRLLERVQRRVGSWRGPEGKRGVEGERER